jgi:hypothetical protein
MVGLAESRMSSQPVVEAAGITQADIGACTAFGAVKARKLVALKQRRRVKNEALGVLIGDATGKVLIRAHKNLGDGSITWLELAA